ncbi:MAG: ornithine carbamoyltransferase [Candidatus Anaerobiospirillum merdipullorum]|uniref:Ornithine carbamoyltransferase n=1 Tax=Candidatus Anaerobiospirillum merdipullorum TaxID=2838450 RepID=A0A9E2KL51_9GAMM|nr:ornithine carbamoyltransferase [Candidatus Anaerobiospirillum merdipullorum]
MRHLLTGFEFSQDEYLAILEKAAAMKKDPAAFADVLKGKAAAIMFEKPSLRTRTTFEIALFRLGAHGVYLDLQGGDLGKRESIGDYARNLSRWTDCLIGRVFSQHTLEELAATGSVPVINALSDLYHPAQAMADYMTVQEHLGALKGLSLAYVGDGNNVANSLLVAGATLGVNVSCFCPTGHGPDIQIFNKASEIAQRNGCKLEVLSDPSKIQGFDVLYTDTWVSMGDNTPLDSVKKIFMPYQINDTLVAQSGARCVLHCLPAHRGYEITDEVMDGPLSAVFDEAENRLHIHMALLAMLIEK